MRPILKAGLAVLIVLGVLACGPTATNVEPQRILFISDRDGNEEIFAMDADGSNQTRLTTSSSVGNDVVENLFPSPSPDGSKIVFCTFTGDVDSKFEIWINVMDADGSNQIGLSGKAAGLICGGAWSPDSTKIAFSSRRDDNLDIYLVDADGANETRLTHDPADDRNPRWSPDGRKIVFSSLRKAITRTSLVRRCAQCDFVPETNANYWDQIYVIDVDGSNEIRLSSSTTDLFDDTRPEWSPDGRKIAFLSDRDEALGYQMYVMDVDGSNETPLTNHSHSIESFYWSPDGKKILYSFDAGGNDNVQLYVVDADGSNVHRLLTGYGRMFFSGLAWSPDGRKIVFNHDKDYPEQIYVMDANGSNQTNLSNNSASDVSPAWGPR